MQARQDMWQPVTNAEKHTESFCHSCTHIWVGSPAGNWRDTNKRSNWSEIFKQHTQSSVMRLRAGYLQTN